VKLFSHDRSGKTCLIRPIKETQDLNWIVITM
jgi:hypothetical protein